MGLPKKKKFQSHSLLLALKPLQTQNSVSSASAGDRPSSSASSLLASANTALRTETLYSDIVSGSNISPAKKSDDSLLNANLPHLQRSIKLLMKPERNLVPSLRQPHKLVIPTKIFNQSRRRRIEDKDTVVRSSPNHIPNTKEYINNFKETLRNIQDTSFETEESSFNISSSHGDTSEIGIPRGRDNDILDEHSHEEITQTFNDSQESTDMVLQNLSDLSLHSEELDISKGFLEYIKEIEKDPELLHLQTEDNRLEFLDEDNFFISESKSEDDLLRECVDVALENSYIDFVQQIGKPVRKLHDGYLPKSFPDESTKMLTALPRSFPTESLTNRLTDDYCLTESVRKAFEYGGKSTRYFGNIPEEEENQLVFPMRSAMEVFDNRFLFPTMPDLLWRPLKF